MTKFFIVFFALISPIIVFGQKVDYGKIIPPDNVDYISMEEKLVRLAWKNYPTQYILQSQEKKANESISSFKNDWAKNVSLNFHVNQGPFLNNNNTNFYYPLFSAGLSFNLATFSSNKDKINIIKEDINQTQLTMDREKLAIRSEMLKRYKIYHTNLEILKIKAQATEDAHSTHLIVSQKFKKGESSLEDLNRVTNDYSQAQENELIAEKEVYLSKVAIEEMIGVRLEEVE